MMHAARASVTPNRHLSPHAVGAAVVGDDVDADGAVVGAPEGEAEGPAVGDDVGSVEDAVGVPVGDAVVVVRSNEQGTHTPLRLLEWLERTPGGNRVPLHSAGQMLSKPNDAGMSA
jgi:hypothetical protein